MTQHRHLCYVCYEFEECESPSCDVASEGHDKGLGLARQCSRPHEPQPVAPQPVCTVALLNRIIQRLEWMQSDQVYKAPETRMSKSDLLVWVHEQATRIFNDTVDE